MLYHTCSQARSTVFRWVLRPKGPSARRDDQLAAPARLAPTAVARADRAARGQAADQRHGNHHPPAHTIGQLEGVGVAVLRRTREADTFQRLGKPAPGSLSAATGPGDQILVVQDVLAVIHAVGSECTTVQESNPPCPNTQCCNVSQVSDPAPVTRYSARVLPQAPVRPKMGLTAPYQSGRVMNWQAASCICMGPP